MAKVDPRDFYLNTDYEMDKIVYFTEGEINKTKDIPHNLGFKPLVFGVCAFNSDFSDPRSLPFEEITQSNALVCTLYSFDNKVQIGFGNYEDTPAKAYYRIYGFEPSDSHAKVGATSNHANTFILNTDYNYCKLYEKGIVNGDATITHNLGYVPQVLAWQENQATPDDPTTVVSPVETSVPSDPITDQPRQIRVTNNTVTFQNFGKVHYRIYYDEA